MLTRNIVAVIDVGSNSIKLLVAQKGIQDGFFEKLFSKTLEVRIGEGISQQNPKLTKDSMRIGSQAIAVLVHLAKNYGPQTVKIVATSAVREASNKMEFLDQVKEAVGIRLDILSGVEEATFIGEGLRQDPLIADLEHFIHMDIGGGSLELIRFSNNTIEKVCSLQLGAVRLTEKFVSDGNPAISRKTEVSIRNHVLQSVQSSNFPFEPTTDPMIVTGGAFSAIRSILAAQPDEVRDREHASHASDISGNDINELKVTLCSLSLRERKALPGMPLERADVMPAAIIAIDTVLNCAGRKNVTQSTYSLRYGIAAKLLG